MSKELLLKGFEVELFTGLATGEHVGVSSDVVNDLSEFVTEPDQRNLEYITDPFSEYEVLKDVLLAPRKKLREWLSLKHLTLFPGSTLGLGNSEKFERSDPLNPYHDLIERTYGTKVVTTSIHINLGIKDLPRLFAAIRLVRCEASLLLALSASSPFLDGIKTGAHSQRWLQFPLTPKKVPLFHGHSHYVEWLEEKLAQGIMWNERHLWTSVRPNGPARPYDLNRLELRICDCITNCDLLLAITALLELRILCLFDNPNCFDPAKVSSLSADELADLSDRNDQAAAQNSLEANLHHWIDGQSIICRDWISQLLDEVMPIAKKMDMVDLLSPIHLVLEQGNQAMKWLEKYNAGQSVEEIVRESIVQMESEESLSTQTQSILG
jgi:predicted glutamate--cysteine ligase